MGSRALLTFALASWFAVACGGAARPEAHAVASENTPAKSKALDRGLEETK